MRDYSSGIRVDGNEGEYQAWLREHSDGFVVSLRSHRGQFSLHHPSCTTLSYDLEAKRQTERSGKLCFDNRGELEGWVTAQPNLQLSDLNRCSRCHRGPASN